MFFQVSEKLFEINFLTISVGFQKRYVKAKQTMATYLNQPKCESIVCPL